MSIESQVLHGDCRELMREMDADSIDSIVTDPPYGLSFMGKGWDKGVPGVEFWVEALRVAKPGAHLLAFGGTRMVHRLAVAIEDAGWEIRDRIHWVYGSGFPKSHDISKGIDKVAGADREERIVRSFNRNQSSWASGKGNGMYDKKINVVKVSDPITDAAKRWDGWGTALKPAVEPIIMARKPFKSTVAANVLEHGTGGINIDGCRIGQELRNNPSCKNEGRTAAPVMSLGDETQGRDVRGRWPSNFIHDGSDEATAGMGEASRYFYRKYVVDANRENHA